MSLSTSGMIAPQSCSHLGLTALFFLNREQLNLIITNNQSALIKFVNTCMILDTTQVVVEISQEVYDIFYFDKSYIFVCKCIATQIIYKT